MKIFDLYKNKFLIIYYYYLCSTFKTEFTNSQAKHKEAWSEVHWNKKADHKI